MKNLKLLGVLLVSFMIMGLNVNAENIEKITLEEDSTTVIEVAADKTVEIDLNGKKLTVVDNHAIIVNEGATVTITGNGIVNAKEAAVFNKGGNVIIDNGEFSSSAWYTIKNLGTMTINGGVIKQAEDNTGNASLVSNGWYSSVDNGIAAPDKATVKEAKAIMTINGGTFNHYRTTSTIKSDDWSKTTINGGNFNSAQGTLVQATGEVLVTGGNFVGYNSIAVFNGTEEEGYEPAILTISGGTFSANSIIWPFTTGTLTITAGTFNNIESIVNTEKDGKEAKYIITGGTFAIDVNDYLEDGLYATKTDKGYEVGKPVVESEIEVLDPEKVSEVKEVTVGVKENEKTDTIIAQSILKDDKLAEKTKDISVNVNVEIEAIKEENASEEVKTAMKAIKESAGKATVAHFFDVSILVKNTNTGESLGNVTNLTEEIELMILLPENLKNTDAKLNRNYYVLREHDGKVDTIKAELSKDGKYLVFKTDKFSTYALAYEDVAKVDVKVPQTADGITTSIIAGTLAIVSAAGISLYLKKRNA